MPAGIFVTDVLPDEARAVLSGFDLFEREADDAALARCEVLMAWPGRVTPELLRKMGSLRMVQSMAAGVDALDFSSLRPGVEVFSNAGAFTENVGEHAWGILLGAAKGVHSRRQRVVPRALRMKTLLVVGCGAIGSEVARLSRSLGMKTVGLSRSFASPEQFDERRPLSDLGEVIGSADAIVIALPLTRSTRGLFGAETLARAKETVVIANVGRGELVDEAAMMGWLRSRPESRYVTDVFWKENGKEDFESPAWGMSNFSGTLHVAGTPVGENLLKAKLAAATNVRRFLDTGSARNRTDPSEYAGLRDR